MRTPRANRIAAFVSVIILCFALVAMGASVAAPVRTRLFDAFDAVIAWDGFGLLADDAGLSASPSDSKLPVVLISDLSGKLLAVASWDGSPVKINPDGSTWNLPLSAQVDGKPLSLGLIGSWTGKTTMAWGISSLRLNSPDDAKALSKYQFAVRFAGASAWVSKDGSYAVVKSFETDGEGLSSYLLIRTAAKAAAFKTVLVKEHDKTIATLVATLKQENQGLKEATDTSSLEITFMKAWSEEVAQALALAWNEGTAKPDVRIFGAVDKPKASPGERLKYIYFLFNSGMDFASKLSITIPVPAGSQLDPGTLRGDAGKAKLMPSGTEISLAGVGSNKILLGDTTSSIQWEPQDTLAPGAIIRIVFEVVLK